MPTAPSDHLLDLPPGFRAIGLREVADAFATAQRVATEEGAGTLAWTRRFDLVEIAVVLEPDEPLATARRVFFAGMNAAADALAVHCPPEKPIVFAWPDTILLDGGLIGGARLAWPAGSDERESPEWLVFGLMLRLMMHNAPASRASTSLEGEGFEVLDAPALIASFTRHLKAHVHTWHDSGFKPIGADYLARLSPEKGTRRGLDANGDLLVHRGTDTRAAERRPLVPALQAAGWYDPATREPLI